MTIGVCVPTSPRPHTLSFIFFVFGSALNYLLRSKMLTSLLIADRDMYTCIDGSTARRFGAHERRYLALELKPLLEALGGVTAADHGGGGGGGRGPEAATAMAFTRRMEEVRTACGCAAAVTFCCGASRSVSGAGWKWRW